ncbi:hypothetical protein I3F58_16200 [Streptomyces sp. MUM 203J]|uniref:hypothetical protein n=1 Tax=Streptomyces sp. MUM 203J TaxID=2791990 RepID=UPI001F04096F|nr:hypothetical protein [Streptomyces sp. MUM 203J]MCH0541081.1 hypothetical protein [Streptomyces sp. MUM 203J]
MTGAGLVLPPTDRQTPAAALLQPPEAQSLDAALAEMRELAEEQGHVLVLYPASLPGAFERRLHTVRSLLENERIALLRSSLPPLALAVLVRQLRQLSVAGFSAGVVASAARLLTHYLHAGAQLTSVAKLDRVPVSLRAHAKSWVPGAQFGVVAAPAPQLVRIGNGDLNGPPFATRLAVARGQLQSDWVTATLAPAWQARAVHEVELPGDSALWWGTGRLVEFVAYLPEYAMVHQLVSSVLRTRCHWCGAELIGDRCAFCSAPPVPHHQPA